MILNPITALPPGSTCPSVSPGSLKSPILAHREWLPAPKPVVGIWSE